MEENSFKDNYTLFIKANDHKKEQILTILKNAIKRYNPNIKCNFRIRMCENNAFVRVNSSEIYYLLLGRNPDGTYRVKKNIDGTLNYSPPLVFIEKVSETNNNLIKILPAHVRKLDPKYVKNVIKCNNVPSEITEDDLKRYFNVFASDGEQVYQKVVKGIVTFFTYPSVNMDSNRTAFVTFNPNTKDSQFCLLLCNKIVIEKGGKKFVLKFSNSFRTERDKLLETKKIKKVRRELFEKSK